ncbi:YbjQ family protein [Rhizobium leguminosarum]|uniref:YbjQ family protein n=1 Tax=Rhizobium leguminosarum TaxID=384 RepID=UPI0021BBC467|nr:YbjQ family protein [Rhizobium leguminosarum]
MTTSIDVPNRKVESVISIIAAEAALGMNIFRDIANNWRDFVGGRSNSSQKSLREARLACLDELRREAAAVGADAVIAVDLDYNELSTSGSGGILFVAASGTAVKLAPL